MIPPYSHNLDEYKWRWENCEENCHGREIFRFLLVVRYSVNYKFSYTFQKFICLCEGSHSFSFFNSFSLFLSHLHFQKYLMVLSTKGTAIAGRLLSNKTKNRVPYEWLGYIPGRPKPSLSVGGANFASSYTSIKIDLA